MDDVLYYEYIFYPDSLPLKVESVIECLFIIPFLLYIMEPKNL